MNVQFPQFGCFILPDISSSSTVFLSDVGSDGRLNRQRKEHAKSRFGCANCKKRKVKCDEQQPCCHCVKRNQKCVFPGTPSSSGGRSATSDSSASSSKSQLEIHKPITSQQISPINLQHLQLFHHFENFTSQTFVLVPSSKWKDEVSALALQNEFLMNAVFLVSASHLHHLQPNESRHQKAALEHLSHVLPGFRNALVTLPVNSRNSKDALIACSMLLLQHAWAFTPSTPSDVGVDGEGLSSLLGLYSGLRYIIREFGNGGMEGSFKSMLLYSPRLTIEAFIGDTTLPSEIEAFFGDCLTCAKKSNGEIIGFIHCHLAASHLIPILCALQLARPDLETAGLLDDVARYLFAWPSLLTEHFISLVKVNDERSQVVMLYFFAAVLRLRSKKFWWMRERSMYMFEAILSRMGDRCEDCTSSAKKLSNGQQDIVWQRHTSLTSSVDEWLRSATEVVKACKAQRWHSGSSAEKFRS